MKNADHTAYRYLRRAAAALLALVLLLSCAFALTPEDYNAEMPEALTSDQLYATAAILMDADSGDVLFSKSAQLRMHPASTTKIMTLLLGLESGIPLDRQIAIPQSASNVPSDSTLIPVFPGETMSFGDLLQGFFTSSGNDGANAIAILVSGTIDNFVALMNQRAMALGCQDTHFANAHGYTAQDHYTTAYDMALIARKALSYPEFRRIASQTRVTIHVNERGDLPLTSTHLIQQSDSSYYYKDCIGIKTGSTEAAGKCFVGAAEREGVTIISVVFQCPEDSQRWIDTRRLFDYGWTKYDRYTLDAIYRIAAPQIGSFRISNAASDDPFDGRLELDIAQLSSSGYLRMIEHDRADALQDTVDEFIASSSVRISDDLTAPITRGEIMGDIAYTDPDTGTVITARLIASRDVEERTVMGTLTDLFPFLKIFSNRLFLVLLGLIALILLLVIILVCSRRSAKQRRRRRIYEQRRYAERSRRRRAADPYDDEDDDYDEYDAPRRSSKRGGRR